MASIWFCGDVHGRFAHVLLAIKQAVIKPVAIVFLGDLDPQKPLHEEFKPFEDLGVQVFFIFGNHETDEELTFQNTWGSPAFEQRCIHGKVVEVAGLRIAGLGGVFRGEIWYPRASSNAEAVEQQFRSYDHYRKYIQQKQGIKRRLSKQDQIQAQAVPSRLGNLDLLDASKAGRLRKNMSSIFPDDYDKMADMKCDILVSHESPAPHHPNGFDELTLLAQSMGAKQLWHGHHHDRLSYRHHDHLGFQGYGVGYRGISALDTETFEVSVVLAGELDDNRMFRQQRMPP